MITLRFKMRTKAKLTRKTRSTTRRNRPGPRSSDAGLAVKEQLLKSAKTLFARHGLSGISIRDIARASKINSSMISYYFQSKEGLYRECFRAIAKSRQDSAQRILSTVQDRKDFETKLGLMIDSIYSLFLEDRDAGLIIVREYDRVQSPASVDLKDSFNTITQTMTDFFKQGQKRDFVDAESDPFLLASIFFGALITHMRIDHINEKTYGRTLKNSNERDMLKKQMIRLFTR